MVKSEAAPRWVAFCVCGQVIEQQAFNMSSNNLAFQYVSPFPLQECVARLSAEDGQLLRLGSTNRNARSKIRAKVEIRAVDPDTVAFELKAARFTGSGLSEPAEYLGHTGHVVKGYLRHREDGQTDIQGVVETNQLLVVDHWIVSVLLGCAIGGLWWIVWPRLWFPGVIVGLVGSGGAIITLRRKATQRRVKLLSRAMLLLHASSALNESP